MASTSGSKVPESAAQPPTAAAARECESCRSAPGIPFCRVEWSFLCTGCAAVVHGNNCIVSVTPNPNANMPHFPYYPYPYPYPYPFANPSSDPNAVVHLSSDEDELSPADGQRRGWRQIPGKATSYRRMESVMRYREKRKSRKFEKTVRYENRRAYAELRPRLDGKFASSKGGEGKEVRGPTDAVDEVVENAGKDGTAMGYIGMDQVSVRAEAGGELDGLVAGGVELGQPDFIEDVRFQ
ncbi:uncharacterized protein LOC110031712 [Phalaenopsis equestris]|uniref:uncharacterized protein LOC110031712 n=1 Tax=Phalaenopsis equestris TaxID=78828 RepID=UPI0009E294D9|nr:uncharacterized protein LOC110031712 [Phalaenopsis equestris]XP_020590721.1 uncharacterized protein LOC110031712 [Phalaenopsis equestris]XP_020590722.1 uncharacterized protein LOC110031712 [Phalaenopsis equestris]